ncbi:GerMN domain-containing protein [Terracoccus luteus]|uniref:GerMN domain-containing protein n=1 Tax=Terracoccus luteus TaxID=53356 RepID=A0A839PSM7_9MICO|nr:GerMN domain-containing protein [Terracoccus luteus]MBB2985784.1 hypothetical protein [Terracoccus luteus]MCP2171436.1 hypothetical protein [Terracoccus luteus]
MTGGRARAALLAALAAVLVLAGCTGLPGSGPVVEGRELGDSVQQPIRVTPQGPFDGASPETIAKGFVKAGEDGDEAHQIGKEFLTPSSVDLWRWSEQDVYVYDSLTNDLTARAVGNDRVEVSTTALARVTPEGRYVELAPGTVVKVTFALARVSGEWRVQLPRTGFGLWLDSNAFDRLFTNRSVYYVTPAGRKLVPDSRWFPNGPRLTTALARAQLEGVPGYLAGAVTTGVPARTGLTVNAVPVDGSGRAVVDLSNAALEADPDGRTAMWAQLTATLSQVSGVTSVSLAVDGSPLVLGGLSSVKSAADLGFEQVGPVLTDTALLRDGSRLTRIDPRYIPDSSVDDRAPDTKPRDGDVTSIPDVWAFLALSVDSKEIAAVGVDRVGLSLWRATEEPLVLDPFGTELTRPAYDSSGFVWLGGLDTSGAPRVFTVGPTAGGERPAPKTVSVPWLAGRRVVALSVSPEGARLLIVTTKPDGSDPQLGVSGISRSANGEPTALATPWRQALVLDDVRDALWLGPGSFAVLGTLAGETGLRPWVGTLGAGLDGVRRRGAGDPASGRLAAVPRAESITSVGDQRGLIVVTDQDAVLARAGASWRRIATGNELLVAGR